MNRDPEYHILVFWDTSAGLVICFGIMGSRSHFWVLMGKCRRNVSDPLLLVHAMPDVNMLTGHIRSCVSDFTLVANGYWVRQLGVFKGFFLFSWHASLKPSLTQGISLENILRNLISQGVIWTAYPLLYVALLYLQLRIYRYTFFSSWNQ